MYDKIKEILESGIQAEYKLEEIAVVLSEEVDDVIEALEVLKKQMEVVLFEQERY